jgi:hypothetical protein
MPRGGVLAGADHRAARPGGALAPEAAAVVAFRGYSAVAPENTLAALRAAREAGIPRAWVEVRSTADGALVLLADETLDRTTTCSGRVADLAAAAVTACDAGERFDPAFAGETVPLLTTALAEEGIDWQLFLADAAVEPLVQVVKASPAADRVAYVAEGEDEVAALRAAHAEAAVWLRVESLSSQAIEVAVDLGATGLALPPGPLNQAEVDEAGDAGLGMVLVDVADDRTAAVALSQGVRHLVAARVEPLAWALGYRFRSYLPADLGRPALGVQGFVRTLAGGDLNGDGLVDLALGIPLDDTGGESAGWVSLALGAERFPGPVQGQGGGEANGQWGSVLGIGDYNADGFDDLAIGYPQRDFSGTDSGAVWLIDGGPGGLGVLSRPIGSQAPASSHLGAALATLDFNGDTVPDLAIAAPDRPVSNIAGAGQVTVMPGLRGSGPVATGSLVLDRTTEQMDPEVEVPGDPVRNERLGAALAAGDFDGDGFDDLAVGVPGAGVNELSGAGAVLVAYGAAAEMDGAPALRAVRSLDRASIEVPGEPERAAGFGAALLVADFDADGRDDLVVGVPDGTVGGRRNAGEVVLLYGGQDGFDAARGQVIHQDSPLVPGDPESRERFGAHLTAGDANGDGFPDLVVGLPDEAVAGQPGVGTLTVIYGSATGLDPRVALQVAPATGYTGFPSALRQAFGRASWVGDLNRDGAPDLAIGVPGLSSGGVEQGALVVGWGYSPTLPGVATPTSPPPSATPPPTITRTPRPTRTVAPTVSPTPSRTPPPPEDLFLPFAARLLRLVGR